MNLSIFTSLSGGVYFALVLLLIWVLVILHLLLFKLWKRPGSAGKPNSPMQEHDPEDVRFLPTVQETNKDHAVKMEDLQRMKNDLLNELAEVKTLLAGSGSGEKQGYPSPASELAPAENTTKDSIKELRAYLKTYYSSDSDKILEMILSIPKHLNNESGLKDLIIRCAAALDFANLSEKRSLDFCVKASEALVSFQISLCCPRIGEKFDPESMSFKKQFSDSERVSKVLYFGLNHNNRIAQKAVVNVG